MPPRASRLVPLKQRLSRQSPRHRVVVGRGGGISLDRVDHRVDTGRGGDIFRQAEREIGVENGQIRQEEGAHDALFLRLARGQDGNRRHLRARAGGGRHQHQRQARSPGVADAISIGKPLVTGRKQRDDLRNIHRRAAADAQNAGGAMVLRRRNAREDIRLGRIGRDIIEDRNRDAASRQLSENALQKPELAQALVRDQQDALTEDGADERDDGAG
jgi:hypothetical protein